MDFIEERGSWKGEGDQTKNIIFVRTNIYFISEFVWVAL